MSHSKKQGNKQPINDKTYVKLLECESGSFLGGTVGQKGAILVVLLQGSGLFPSNSGVGHFLELFGRVDNFFGILASKKFVDWEWQIRFFMPYLPSFYEWLCQKRKEQRLIEITYGLTQSCTLSYIEEKIIKAAYFFQFNGWLFHKCRWR